MGKRYLYFGSCPLSPKRLHFPDASTSRHATVPDVTDAEKRLVGTSLSFRQDFE